MPPPPLEDELAPGQIPVSSRVAESFYWAGRYIERARGGAHQAGLLENIRWTELSPDDYPFYWPLWRAVGASFDFKPFAEAEEFPSNFSRKLRQFLFSNGEYPSILSSLRLARRNLETIRDWVSPEVMRVITRLVSEYEALARAGRLTARRLLDACVLVSDELARFEGTATRTLLHDATWEFHTIGGAVERLNGTIALLRSIIPGSISLQHRHIEDDTDLTALLRLLGCLDAYRREYRSRAYLDRVIRLIWSAESSTASLVFNIKILLRGFQRIGDGTVRNLNTRLRLMAEEMLKRAEGLVVSDIFPARTSGLDFGKGSVQVSRRALRLINRELTWYLGKLGDLHKGIEDRYFHHQVDRGPAPAGGKGKGRG